MKTIFTLCSIFLISLSLQAQYEIIQLQHPDGSFFPSGLNENRQVCGTALVDPVNFINRAVRFEPDGSITTFDIGELGESSSASQLNDHGHVIGSINTTEFTTMHVVWESADEYRVLEEPEGFGVVLVQDVNNNGESVGYILDGIDPNRAIYWDVEGNLQELPAPAAGGEAYALNDQNEVVGLIYTDIGGTLPVLWKPVNSRTQLLEWEIIELGSFGGNQGRANDINNNTQIVGFSFIDDSTRHGFFWEDGLLSDINNATERSVQDGINSSIITIAPNGFGGGEWIDLDGLIVPIKYSPEDNSLTWVNDLLDGFKFLAPVEDVTGNCDFLLGGSLAVNTGGTIVPKLSCPEDRVVFLEDPLSTDFTGTPVAENFCSSNLEFDFTDEIMSYSHGGSLITRTHLVNDDCGNTGSCIQTIEVQPLDGIGLYQNSYEYPFILENTMEGFMSFTVSPNENLFIMNIQACPVNGTVSPEQCAWLVQNHLFEPTSEGYTESVCVNFSNLGYQEGDDISDVDLKFHIGSEVITEYDPLDYSSATTLTSDVIKMVLNLGVDPGVTGQEVPETGGGQAQFDNSGITLSKVRHNMPNIDLDVTNNGPGSIPGYIGDLNACASAAVANSMQWLEKRYDKIEDTKTSLREKLVDISSKMDRPADGATIDQILKGKLAYANANNHSIKIEYQSRRPEVNNAEIKSPNLNDQNIAINKKRDSEGIPDWKFLVDAICDGKDVELQHSIYNVAKNESYSHAVMVAGVREIGGRRQILIVDDIDQNRPGGLRAEWTDWVLYDKNKPWLGSIADNALFYRVVQSVVCEGYDKDVTQGVYNGSGHRLGNIRGSSITNPSSVSFSETVVDPEKSSLILSINTEENGNRRSQEFPNWAVRNVIIPDGLASLDTFYLWWSTDVINQPFIDDDTILLGISLDDQVSLNGEIQTKFAPSRTMTSETWELPDGSNQDESILTEFTVPETPEFTSPDIQTGFIAEFQSDVDLDSSTFQANSMYAGDWGACGPAAAAGIIHHLNKGEDSVGVRTHLMGISAMASRTPEQGVSAEQLVGAILGFLDSNQISIALKHASERSMLDIQSPDERYGHFSKNMGDGSGIAPPWDSIKASVDRGNPVLLQFGEYDAGLNRIKGFYAIAKGYQEVGTVKSLWLSFDLQTNTENSVHDQLFTLSENEDQVFLANWSDSSSVFLMETAIFMSYDESVTFGPTGVDDHLEGVMVAIYPNPSNHYFTVEIGVEESGSYTLDVFNLLGQKITSREFTMYNGVLSVHTFETSQWSNGLYLCRLKHKSKSLTRKIAVFR